MKVALADDHRLFMDAVRHLIEPEFKVVGTFVNGRELIDAIPSIKPDIVIIDIAMPTLNGLSAALRINTSYPQIKMVFLTMYEDEDSMGEAFRAGASAYVVKSAAGSELIEALRAVSRGGYYASPTILSDIPSSFVKYFKQKKKSVDHLTARQLEVLQLFGEGYSMKEIANILEITLRTVKFHKYTIMNTLNISTSAELILFAIKHSRLGQS